MSILLTNRTRAVFRILLYSFLWLSLFRIAFLLFLFPGESDSLFIEEVLKGFYIGAKFDLRLLAGFCLIVLILSKIVFLDFTKKSYASSFWATAFHIFLALHLIFSLTHIGAYGYWKIGVNSTLLKYLENPFISAQMIWETYPVIPIVVAAVFVFYLSYKKVLNWLELARSHVYWGLDEKKKNKFLPWVFFLAISGTMIYGKVSYYPLRWSEAFFSGRPFISMLAMNPVLYFFNTFNVKELDVKKEIVQEYFPIIADYLGIEPGNQQSLNFVRQYTPEPKFNFEKAPNIVLIVMESLTAFKTSSFGNPLKATPYLDEIASQGWSFEKFYVVSQATARSIFAAVTGLGDLSSDRSASRNPLMINQHTILKYFENYQKMYFLGGSANWGQIRGIFTNNVPGIEIYEEGDYSSPRVDVWGISDFDLFEEAHNVLLSKHKNEKPFFAFIQTSGFHRPYSIPKTSKKFEITTFSDKSIPTQNGFNSAEEFNSLKFQDFSLGHFLDLAKKSPYFENTIFIVYGDHGLPPQKSPNLKEKDAAHGLTGFHVPLVIYAPKYITPKVDKRVVSQVDVLPTIASMIGLPYTNTTLGRDLFDPQFEDSRYAFVYFWFDQPDRFGLISDQHFFVKSVGTSGELYDLNSSEPSKPITSIFPEQAKKMLGLTDALYFTNKYLMFNNNFK